MKGHPILFSKPMVQAILGGTKTQTRRIIKPHPFWDTEYQPNGWWYQPGDGGLSKWPDTDRFAEALVRFSPHKVGHQLWVRENGWQRPARTAQMMRNGADTWAPYYYDADPWTEQDVADFKAWGFKRRPSIHMPRWASRITLEIASVRAERLLEISEPDAIAEGVTNRAAYFHLWQQLNGAGSDVLNPWVWVIEFKRIEGANK